LFVAAINKYTWDAFTHEILEEGLTLEEANFWEAGALSYATLER
jgi:hypothetical protein